MKLVIEREKRTNKIYEIFSLEEANNLVRSDKIKDIYDHVNRMDATFFYPISIVEVNVTMEHLLAYKLLKFLN